MEEDLLECDIDSVLSSWRGHDDFSVLQSLDMSSAKYRSHILTSVAEMRKQKEEITQRNKNSLEIISTLSGQVKEAECKLKNVPLKRKVMEKQISCVLKQQEKLRDELCNELLRKESLSLEMIDLEQEHEEWKKEKKLVWEALKRASRVYKSTLRFHIKILENSEDSEVIQVSFFPHEVFSDTGRCYVELVNSADGWRVVLMHPVLKPEHEDQLKEVVDFSAKWKVRNITAFLCQIRSIFMKHYVPVE